LQGVAGNIKEVAAVVDNLKLCSHLANVGDAKTLVIHPWRTTHQQIPDEEKLKGGVTPDLIRISLGLEHISDIIHDFEQAFEGAGLKPAEGWTPTWKKGLSSEVSDGTLYAPQPLKTNGTKETKEMAARELAASS
jgi:O-acetylhomoserine/O-acetylserine sulfhydrylase